MRPSKAIFGAGFGCGLVQVFGFPQVNTDNTYNKQPIQESSIVRSTRKKRAQESWEKRGKGKAEIEKLSIMDILCSTPIVC